MSDNTSKTLSELYAELQHKTIAEKAEDTFRSKEINSRKFSQKLANMIPVFTVIVWFVAYSLSAPHTSTLFMRITPDINVQVFSFVLGLTWLTGNIAPLAIEGTVALLSGLVEYGQKEWRWLLISILTLSIAVNVVGGLVTLEEYFATADTNSLSTAWQAVSVFAGVIVSLVSYATGKIIVMFATDKIELEIETGKGWFGRAKFYALQEAFYNAALKHGATPTRASKYAQQMASQYCEGEVSVYEDGTVQAIAQPSQVTQADTQLQGAFASVRTVSDSVPRVPMSSNDFGFAGMARGQARVLGVQDSSPTMDSVPSPQLSRMSTPKMIEWLNANGDAWKQYAVGDTKRKKSKAIAYALTGDASGYKTVERAFDRMNIEL